MNFNQKKTNISIVIPTLNEEGNIEHLIDRIDKALRPRNIGYEMIFIDDHSKDKTVSKISSFKDRYPIQVHLKTGQKGKSFSLLEGFKYAQYENVGIIDADLQYPPEAIPEMLAEMDKGFGIVVANRIEKNTSFTRKIISSGFRFIFGQMLHGLSCDVQAGLKIFKKEITEKVKINPTPWTFDLEFLINARRLGYSIGSTNITFAGREYGKSNINLFQTIYEIGSNAVMVKLKQYDPIPFSGSGPKMIGSGVSKNGKNFITHSNLDPKISAVNTLNYPQLFFILSLIVGLSIGFYFWFLPTALVVMATLSAIYFIDTIFNLFLVLKSLSKPPELSFSDEEIKRLVEKDLPIYSVLCPLYREARVLPAFVQAMENLDWPKEKLDILLLLEENDEETISAARKMNLPEQFRIVVVPHSMPKTKPKACNYGLSMAKGDLLVIYDAEDIPDRYQLKKAYLGFKNSPEKIKCLQGKLNYFNPNQNILTRLFTAEYSLWFDVILPGLQSINTTIPLGGTSNHFRTKDLIELGGWDPFNVTEDADLGVRLFKRGYTTAIIDSVTLEEANSNLKNWIRQRSRWIKGYMQTYIVHMRNPIQFFRKSGYHFLLFQMNVGGKIAFILINPILWFATISYFAFRPIAGPIIEPLYPPLVLYLAVFSLIFGNFMYFYYYLVGCAKRGHWSIIKYAFLVPFYWLFMSVAGLMALYELIIRPHYWQKTHHGLHLVPAKIFKAEGGVARSELAPTPSFSISRGVKDLKNGNYIKSLSKKIIPKRILNNPNIIHGGALITAMMISNVFNFLFNALLGNKLTLEDLGLVTLINTLWYVATIFINGMSSTVNHRTAYLNASYGSQAANSFWKTTLRLGVFISLVLSVFWIMAIPFLVNFFQISSTSALLVFTPSITIGIIAAANKGYLQGNLMFHSTAIILITEALSKLLLAIGLIGLGFDSQVYISIPFSIFISAIVAWWLSRSVKNVADIAKQAPLEYQFPTFFYLASLVSSISSAIFLSLDIILVKHFLNPTLAGEYALLSLVGKMIYFFGSLPAVFTVTLVSREEGLGKDPRKIFNAIFLTTFCLVTIGFIGLGIFGRIFVPLLLGERTLIILNDLKYYAFSISIFTLTNVIISYHLAKKQYIFPATSLLASALMIIGITNSHSSIESVVSVMTSVSLFGLCIIGLMHIFESKVKFLSANIQDLFDAFIRAPQTTPLSRDRKRVLIFNWRDTQHKFAGGAEVYIHEIAKRMVNRGDEVTIFCGNDGHSLRNEIVDGINVIRRGGFYMVYFWAFLYYFTQFRKQYDIVVDGHNGIPFFTPLYVREPVICIVHHIHQEVFRRSMPKLMAEFACFLERDLMPMVYNNKYFITVSPSSKRDMIDHGLVGRGIEIVYNGVDLETFKPALENSRPMILYLGRLKAYKSIDILLTSFKMLIEDIPNAQLIIAGSGEEEKHLKRLADQLKISNKIIFTGKVSEEEKINLLQKAWVMVNPSFMEGWGITTIEANACGTPVIASDIPGLRDSVQNFKTGYLVTYGDSRAFAEKMREIIINSDLRGKLAKESRQWAKNFSWSEATNNFSAIIKTNYKTS